LNWPIRIKWEPPTGGWPAARADWPDCRHVYRENLAEALQWQRYCEEEMDHCSHQGTGSDLASRRRKLREAKDDVAYRKRLLAELEDKA
jgi:hypothetical protein